MAQNTLEILIKANAGQAQAVIKSLDKTIDKFGVTGGKGFDGLKAKWAALDAKLASPQGMKAMIGTAGMVAGALVGVGVAVKNLADDYMDYAFQVKDFGRIIGATPEEASKLIQVADDVRLSVGSMTTALRSAITKGYAPTIQGLGQLADKYNAIQDPIQRSKFLVETFGRSGLEMAKLMELGSAKIKEMGDSIEGTGRLMTEEGIAKAQAYYEALDRLGDAAEGAKLSLGGALLPAVTDVATETANLAESGGDLINMFAAMQKAVDRNVITGGEFTTLLAGYTVGIYDLADVTQILTDKQAIFDQTTSRTSAQLLIEGRALQIIKETSESASKSLQMLSGSTEDGEASAWEASEAYKSMASGIAAAAGAAKSLEDVKISFDFKVPDIEDQLANRLKALDWERIGGANLEKLFIDVQPRIAKLSEAEYDAFARQFAGLTLAAQVELGGMSQAEAAQELQKLFGGQYVEAKATIKAALEVDATSEAAVQEYLSGQSFSAKLFPELDVAGLQTAQDEMTTPVETAILPKLNQGMLMDELKKIPSSKTLTINVKIKGLENLNNIGTNTGGQASSGRAVGGPVSPWQPYIVGERGPELFVPNQAGRVVANNQMSNISNAPVTINNYFTIAQPTTNVRELARLVYKEQQRAGVT